MPVSRQNNVDVTKITVTICDVTVIFASVARQLRQNYVQTLHKRKHQSYMKLKLPKLLASAILSSTVAHAALFEPSSSVTEGTITSDTEVITTYQAIAKDGSGTITIEDNASINQAIYVREGELYVGNSDKQITVSLNPVGSADNPSQPYLPHLVVAGKNTGDKYATVTFDNAKLTTYQESTVIIGSADGNGAMVVDNHSQIGLGSAQTTIIGERIGQSVGSPTTDAEGNPYQGSYSDAANGSGAKFGRGVVTVKGGSTLNTGYLGFYMSEGELNASGEGTQVNLGGNYGNYTELGVDADSTSDVNVTEGAKVNVRTKYFFTGDSTSNNTTVNINVDGDGSRFTVDEYTPAHPEVPNSAQATMTVLGYFSGAATGSATPIKSNTAINVTNGGTADFHSGQTMLGYGDMADGSSVTVNVDKDSTFIGKNVYAYKGAEIDNQGRVEVENLYLYGAATITNDGVLDLNELWIYAGEVVNSNTIEGVVVLNAGTFTAMENSRLQAMHLMKGSFKVEGDITMDGFMAGYDAGEIVFTVGSSIDMNQNSFKLNGSKMVIEVDYDVTDSTAFHFEDFILNASETDITADTQIEIRGTNGTSTTRAMSTIPEPTTATLNLLALVALAARRRRA